MRLVWVYKQSELTMVESLNLSILTSFVLTKELYSNLLTCTHQSRMVFQKG